MPGSFSFFWRTSWDNFFGSKMMIIRKKIEFNKPKLQRVLYRVLFQILFILTVCEKHELQKTSSSTLITSPNHSEVVPTWKSGTWRWIITNKKKMAFFFYTPLRPRFRGFQDLNVKKCTFYTKPSSNSCNFFNFWTFEKIFFFLNGLQGALFRLVQLEFKKS